MEKSDILGKITPSVIGRGCFIVDLEVTRDNDITLTVEKNEGPVEMEDCIALSQEFHNIFDQEVEDYSLTVTSAGLDQPFKVPAQFTKAVGSEVTVKTREGKKLVGVLTGATTEEISLRYSRKEAVPGKKKKEMVEVEETFPMSLVNSVTPYVRFE